MAEGLPGPRWVGASIERLQRELAAEDALGLYVVGSLALGDFRDGRSDVDVVVLLAREPAPEELDRVHDRLAAADPHASALACTYVSLPHVADLRRRHHVWSHGRRLERLLPPSTRAELDRVAIAVAGPPARELVPPLEPQVLRSEVVQELRRYWLPAARRPWLWLSPVWVDVGVTSSVRALALLGRDELITKSEAIERLARLGASRRLCEALARYRRGETLSRSQPERLAVAVDASRFVRRVARG